ncbi:Golgi CORVET complex core vacuolar protein 8-domain-containing protein [Radiomyces spectabilis]|uniref:Golgi CORVET complex core vacuolar protein 8-domain-containing protein n=1 Tax=Radiomyces spectabilis TaxID=64574 RepID=UPI002220CF83|nr:Golgi CORVET complex core vacuolar protein 8-domain-containing protein [Radiomyces spectabilis]KAI8374379.1 Golgi CORVET complex core vacuolar protein 8-domain-containing protein [Radiomyces spectabilis]
MDSRSATTSDEGGSDRVTRLGPSSGNRGHLPPPLMQPSISTNTLKFRNNYDALLKEVLEESSEDEEELLNHIDIDLNAATAELPDELRAALEDRSLADKYLANLKTFMSHRRTQSFGSIASGKGDYSTPSTPLQSSFAQPLNSKPLFRMQQDPLSKVLDAIPYQTRLVNGVQSLTVLEQKFYALRIPELDLPTVSDIIIRSRLDDLYKIQDDLYIHLHGGPLFKTTFGKYNIGEKKRAKVLHLLDEISKEIGLYEEFIKRANYLSLDNILNESDTSSIDEYQESEAFETDSSMLHFESSSDILRMTPATSPSPATYASISPNTSFHSYHPVSSPNLLRRATSTLSDQRSIATPMVRRLDSSVTGSSESPQSSDYLYNASIQSPSLSQLVGEDSALEAKEGLEPWEAFKWTPLVKISDHLYSDATRMNSGLVSVLAVSGVIAVGTIRGLVFVYDYSQNLKCVLGDHTRAATVGSVTALAISADHTSIACGHSRGYIVVWDIRKPGHPIRTIEPIQANQATSATSSATTPSPSSSRKEGHVAGAAILHIGFIGVKKSDIVSADDHGMAFYHVLYKVVMVNAVDTTRILGRYQNLTFNPDTGLGSPTLHPPPTLTPGMEDTPKPRKPSTVFAMQPLPLGQVPHPAENFGIVALLTPYKMIIVGLKPTPQTQYKHLKPKAAMADHKGIEVVDTPPDTDPDTNLTKESLAGCLAWLPVTKTGNAQDAKDKKSRTVIPSGDPMLAFSWGNHLFILRIGVDLQEPATGRSGRPSTAKPLGKSKKRTKLQFTKVGEWKCRDSIVGLQWVNRQILVLFTPNEEMILFDPKNMVETERASIRNKQLVYHDWFTSSLKNMAEETVASTHTPGIDITVTPSISKSIEMAYYHSLRGYKGKLFLLGLNQLYMGTLLSWADRILALVRAGDFLEGIQLATLFYNGKCIQTVVGLPEDEQARKKMVGEKLIELLEASLNYAFSSKRTYDGMVDDLTGGGNVLYNDLATGCIDACLSMNRLDFLFDVIYERFAESRVRGLFLEVLEPYIIQDRVPDIPPAVMKNLVDHFSEKKLLTGLEQVIWHVNPQCLDIDQIVSMCHREGLFEAMMYVWNRSMDDYVSPVVEMLKVIRTVLKTESTAPAEPSAGPVPMSRHASFQASQEEEFDLRKQAEKLFDYLKLILTGRTFPDGLAMSSSRANEARSAVYSFIFSGRCVVWPRTGGKLVLTADDTEEISEPTYPYLRLLLRFNTKKTLRALETAFADPWLNGGEDFLTSTFEDEVPGKVISRQIIVNTLLDIMGGGMTGNELTLPPPRPKQSISASTVVSINPSTTTAPSPPTKQGTYDVASNENLVQLYMFIASNLHKYTTFILLPPTTLHKILVRLADDHTAETREERQAAVRHLLTVYIPTDEEHMILLYEEAGFWKVLEDVYRHDRKYGKLVETYLKDDERRDMVFDCVYHLLEERSGLTEKQRNEVKRVFMIRIAQFVEIDGQRTAHVVDSLFGGDHDDVIKRLEEEQEFDDDDEPQSTADKRLFSYLRGLLEPGGKESEEEARVIERPDQASRVIVPPSVSSASIHERYIELMCRFDPSGVYDYISTKLTASIDLEKILESCETYGVIDAAVWIMEKKGDTQGALDKMLEVARENVSFILQILQRHKQVLSERESTASASAVCTFEEQTIISSCLIGLKGVLRVGTRLCENSSRPVAMIGSPGEEEEAEEEEKAAVSIDTSSSSGFVKDTGEDTAENTVPADDATPQKVTKYGNEEVESLWFRLLDAYVESSIEVYNVLNVLRGQDKTDCTPAGLYQHIVTSFKSFIQSIFTSLLLSTSPQISLPHLLLRLVHSQTRGETTFADFRHFFLTMLDTYKYEGKLLEMTNRLFERDLYGGVQEMVRKKGRGWGPTRAVCPICGASILDISLLQPPLAWNLDAEDEATEDVQDTAEKDIAIFHCGHAFHQHCLQLQLGESQNVCVICHHGSSKTSRTKLRSTTNKGKDSAP